jgi:phage terminase large subunit GpA-like protein
MHFPKLHGYEKQTSGYFDQLTAEEVRVTYKKGFPVREYVKIRNRNEALDIRVYFLAAMDNLKPVMAQIQTGLLKQLAPKSETKDYQMKPVEPLERKEPPVPAFVHPSQRQPRRQGGWVNNTGFGGSKKGWM